MTHKTRPTFVVSTRSIWKKLILFGVLVGLLLAPSAQSAESVSAPSHTGSISTATSLSAQGYPTGQHPFMVNKMFAETYQAPLWLNSYFDHKLPIQTDEFLSKIPADLRDTTTTTNFLGVSEPGIITNCTLGKTCYSGHEGIDYNLSGKTIIAPANGEIRVGSESSSCLVWIDHDATDPGGRAYSFSTMYMHLATIANASADALANPNRSSTTLKWMKGDKIRAGEAIGVAGDVPCNGVSKGGHLHFGIASGQADGPDHKIFDPYGWWSNDADPWTDARISNLTSSLHYQPARSLWAWAAPPRPAKGTSSYWGDGIEAQTDDTDASFQKFRAFNAGLINTEPRWKAILPDPAAGVQPIGTGAWTSTSIAEETATVKANWAIWGLHIPADGQYRIQAFFPKLPSNTNNATTVAHYTIYIPTDDTALSIWDSGPINQQANNEWRDIVDANANAVVNLRANTVVLVKLTDETGPNHANETVLFDALRIKAETPVQPPTPTQTGRVGFVIDNSSSMQEQGKIDAVKSALPPWVDQLSASNVEFGYALEHFADNTPPVQQTGDPAQIKAWIADLSANDNGVSNTDCPEESLGAIQQLAPSVQNGNILFFTDDLPHSPVLGTITAYSALASNNVKLHAIILPKTCTFDSQSTPEGWLPYRFLSLVTGGTFQQVNTNKTADALQIVLHEMQTQAQLGSTSNSSTIASSNHSQNIIQSTSVITYPITVDDTVDQMNALLNILSGTFTLTLVRPDGSAVNINDSGVTYIDSGSAQYYEITNPARGLWQAIISGDGEYRFSTSASTSLQFSYLGETRGAPNVPLELMARLSGPIASTSFSIEPANGGVGSPVILHDDGHGNDLVAGDGIYTGWYTPTQIGDYHLRVTGTITTGGTFSRVDTRLIRVQGVRVIAPPAVTETAGASHIFHFQVVNLEATSETYDLNAISSDDWIQQAPPSSVTLAAGATADISLTVFVPPDTPGSSVDTIRLTASKRSDGTVIAEDTTHIFTADPDVSAPSLPTLYLPLMRR